MPETKSVTTTKIASLALHYWHCNQITATTAIDACQKLLNAGQSAIGLFYSPDTCRLVRITGSAIAAAPNVDCNLSHVFELRVFNEAFELRWLHEQSGNGRAVIVTEDDELSPAVGTWSKPSSTKVERQTAHAYQLWGKLLSEDNGWSILTDAQIGELRVPLSGLTKDQRISLTAVEYLGVGDDDGNMIVVEERLTGLKAVDKVGREK